MTFRYIRMRDFKAYKYYFVMLIIIIIFAFFNNNPHIKNRIIFGFSIFLFGFLHSCALVFYHKKHSIVTNDNGLQANYFYKKSEYAWSDVIAVKKVCPGWYKVETKKGPIGFNPKGLLPVELYTGQKEDYFRNLDGVFIGEIARKAPHVRFIRIPKELLRKIDTQTAGTSNSQ